jgi:chromosome segregation ATPase
MDRPDPNGPPRVLLYALTLDDAKRMAQAYFQYARNDWWRGYFDSLVKKAQVNASNVARYQTRLAEIDKRVEVAQKPLEELQKTVPYRTESEAHEAVVELDRMLNAARVEIAGITAKIEAIQGYRWDKPEAWQVIPRRAVPEEAIARLNMMFVEETIALRGAEARKQTATNLREQANRFLDLKSTLTSAAAEKKPLMEDLKDNQNNLASYQRELEVLRQEEPKIPAKVVIYPVQWANKPSQN